MNIFKQLLLIPLLLLLAMGVMAQGFGNFASAVFIQKNGSLGIYNVTGTGADIIGPGGPDYTGDLGAYVQGSGDLILKGAEVKTYKDANGNVCGSNFYYKIHKVGTNGSYVDLNLPYKAGCSNGGFDDGYGPCNGNDQKWNTESQNVDMTNFCAGNYVMDVYYKTPGNGSGTSGCNDSALIGSATAPAGSMTFTITPSPKTITLTADTSVCDGTPFNLGATVSGGNAPYTYSWSGPNGFTAASASASATTAGTYTLAVTDACGAVDTKTITVTTKPKPNAPTVIAGTTACPAGTATLTATGCNGTVTWSNGMTGSSITAPVGAYTATCSENGCTSNASSSVSVAPCPVTPPPAPPTVISWPVSCPAGTAQLDATGCNGTVTWSNGMTGATIVVTPGTYTATCTENGVTSAPSAPVIVAPCPPPTPPVIVSGPTACPAGTATLTATGCNGTVIWSNGMTGSTITVPAGSYTATCLVNGVTSAPSAPITVAPCPTTPPCPPYPPTPPPPPPPCTAAGLLVNGSFEDKVVSYTYTHTTQPGWTQEGPGNNGQIETWRGTTEGAAPVAGKQFIELNNTALGIITQNVTVKKDVPVNLSYYHRSRSSAGGEKIRVDIVDRTTNNVIHTFQSVSTNSWKKFKTVFTPTSNSIQLRMVSLNTCNNGTGDAGCGNLIDNVVMNYAACECTFVPDAPVICAPQTDLCSNGTITITAQGCTGGTIKWNNGQTGPTLTTNVPGTYYAQCFMPGNTCESAPSNQITLNGCNDVSVSCPTFEWRSNGVYHIKFCVKNNGYAPASGTAYCKVNGVLVYTENYSNLPPGGTICYVYRARYLPCGSTVYAEVGCTVIGTETNPYNNVCTGSQPMNCVCNPPPYDPNYKDPMPKRNLEGGIFKSDEWLTYTVHCQNDGRGIAHNVIMIDTIDVSKLDINSIQVLSSKDPMQFRRVNDHIVAFDFIGVNLTSSFNDLPRSQTEVVFKIKRLPGQEVGTEILNKVGIYFDHEAVVETEFAFSKIIEPCDASLVNTGIVSNDKLVTKGDTVTNAFKLLDYSGIITGWQVSTDPTFTDHVKSVDNYTGLFDLTSVIDSVTYVRALVQTGGCAIAPSAKATIYPVCGNMIKNGSFENPDLGGQAWALRPVPNWSNLVDDNNIEIQKNLYATATDGSQYAELNGTKAGIIYQDVPVMAGKELSWRLDHKARTAGNESIAVTLSAPDGSNSVNFNHTASKAEWQTIGGRYKVADGQTMVRLKITSTISTTAAAGNLIDNVALDYADCNNTLMASASLVAAVNTGNAVAGITIMPNPVTTNADIDLTGYEEGAVSLHVMDATGRILKNIRYNYVAGAKYTLNLSDLADGIYLIKVQQGGKWASAKVLKK